MQRSAPADALAAEVTELLQRLFPLMRSITGAGVRETHRILGEVAPLERIEVPSGTPVLDWTVPKEWAFREAYVIGPDGRRVIDTAAHNLHLVNYSAPFRGRLSRQALDAHLHSLPEMPDAIPYVTSYYREDWGFCVTQRQRDSLPEGDYEVVVDCDLIDGAMTLSEAVLPGESTDEVFFSCYTCHPSLANDELCAPIALALLLRHLAQQRERRLTYRFVFLPETIGSIAYLSLRGEHLMRHMVAGFALADIGLPKPYRIKGSRRGDSLADRAALHLLPRRAEAAGEAPPQIVPFAPVGSDERQYCSPGFDLPVVSLTRGEAAYPEYHTSLDDLALVSPETVARTVEDLAALCALLDRNRRYRNLKPQGEPQLGRYGLYPTKGSRNDRNQQVVALLWALNQADGAHDLLATAEKSGLAFDLVAEMAEAAAAKGLLAEITGG